jgi:OHCU decarboxylase
MSARTDRGLDRLNRLPADQAEPQLRTCCASRRWAAALAAGRPYPTRDALLERADHAWWALDERDWEEAFAAHPRIGERDRAGASERREQAGVAGASAALLAALAEANRLYEERFGRVYVVCATGRGAGELLEDVRRRLDNEPAVELRVAAAEQARITRLRLERLLG